MSKGEGSKIGIAFSQELVGDITGKTPIPTGYKAGTTDIAQGRPVTVGNATYGGGSNAVDGNNSTYWGTYSTMPWWISVDLGEVKKTAGFYILQSNGSYRGRAYTIYGSNDNVNFDIIQSGELANVTDQTIEYPARDYRYIKLSVTSYWSSSRMYVYTLKILEAEPTGNELAFTVTGQQYRYINGDLLDMNYKVISVEPHPTVENAILLTFDTFSRFPTVEGDLTVVYDASKGNLSGAGGAVESFTQVFTPTDLIPEPNPGIQEYISVSPEIELEFIEVEYPKAYHRETITGAPAEPIVSFDYEYKVRKCWMEATTQLVKLNSSGQLMEESQNIIISVISKKLTSPVYTFKLVIDSVEYDGYITVSQDKTQLTVDMVSVLANFPSFTEATVKMTMVDVDLTINDYITLYKVQEGSTEVVAFLTNEYHDVVAMYDTQSVETEQKLVQALSYIKVYQGFNDITDEYTFTKSEVSTKSLFYPTRNQIQIVKLEELNGQVTLTGTHPTLPTVNKTMMLKKDQRGLVVNP